MSSGRMGYLLKKFPRLSETFILNEILAQEDRGRDLHVFSRRQPDDEVRHPAFGGLRARVEVLPPVRELNPWPILFANQGTPLDVLSRTGEVIAAYADCGHPRFANLLSEALYLLDRTRALDIQHLHVHFATDSAVTAMLLRDLGGPTFSITAHAKDIYRSGLDRALLRRLFRGAQFVVTVCDANVRHLRSLLGDDATRRVHRLYNGIDLEIFRPLHAHIARREPSHVLAVGRLVEKKGFHVLLDALALLGRHGEVPRTTIVGDGELRDSLAQQVHALGLTESVELLGAVDQEGVRRLMGRASVFCLPCLVASDGNRDALPTVLLESLACGLPSISTPVSGVPEILDDGNAGVLVPENDPTATAAAIANLLRDDARREALALAGLARVRELFDLRRTSKTLAGWFDGALEPAVEEGRRSCASSV